MLTSGVYYDVMMRLELPESPANVDAGVFMVSTSLLSASGSELVASARPAMLRYRSPLLRTLHTTVFALPLLLGIMEQKQTLQVALIELALDSSQTPVTQAVVRIVSRHPLEIYQASISIAAHFTGLRYYMYHHWLLSAIFGIGWNAFWLFAVLIYAWMRLRSSDRTAGAMHRGGDGADRAAPRAASQSPSRRGRGPSRIMPRAPRVDDDRLTASARATDDDVPADVAEAAGAASGRTQAERDDDASAGLAGDADAATSD